MPSAYTVDDQMRVLKETAMGFGQAAKQTAFTGYGMAREMFEGVGPYVRANPIGRAFQQGALDAIGFDITFGGENRGFLGIKSNLRETYGLGQGGASVPGMGDVYKSQVQMGSTRSYAARTAFKEGGTRAASMIGKTALSSLGLITTGYFAYEGFRQEGAWGAAKGVGESVVYGSLGRLAIQSIMNPVTATLAASAAIGYAGYSLGEAGRRYGASLRNLEMGGDENMINAVNSYGASTMRQRAASMLNNSHSNRRFALGNEAALFHASYR